MSYILEGLKKLEEKRRQEITPSRFSFQRENRPISKGRHIRLIWPYLLCAVLLINAAAIFWLVTKNHKTGKTVVHAKAVPEQGPQSIQKQKEKEAGETSPPLMETVEIKPVQAIRPAQSNNNTKPLYSEENHPAPSQGEAADTGRRKNLEQATKKIAASSSVPVQDGSFQNKAIDDLSRARSVSKQVQGKISVLGDLPPDALNGMPPLKMSVHYYNSDPQARMVRVNDRTLREGQLLAEGLKLEQINSKGAVFSFHGHRFQLGMYENQ